MRQQDLRRNIPMLPPQLSRHPEVEFLLKCRFIATQCRSEFVIDVDDRTIEVQQSLPAPATASKAIRMR